MLAQKWIEREKLTLTKRFLNKQIIKVIAGPRRAGKSVFAFLLLAGKDFAYLNFDDENLLKVKNYDEILEALFEVYPKIKIIFFDEIQNLKNWELFVNKFQRRGYNLVVSGSNAKLLSQELATALTGREITIELLPFSFKEFLLYHQVDLKSEFVNLPENKGEILGLLNRYVKHGGFPEPIVKKLDVKKYLETLFDAVLFKDVVKRHKVRFSQKIYDLALYLAANFSSEFTFNKLKNVLDFNSVATLQKYLNYLSEAYLVLTLNRFSFKLKEQLKAPKKIYLIDNGLILAKSFQFSENIGKLMENLVLVEVLRKGYGLNQDVFYYKTSNGKEVDFLLKRGRKTKQLIQVCYDLEGLNTKEREVKALFKASQELKCANLLIITWDKEGKEKIKGKTIQFIPLWKWLLQAKI